MSLTKQDLLNIEGLLDKKLEPINQRLDRSDAKLDELEAQFILMNNRLDSSDVKLDALESQITPINQKLDYLVDT